MKITFHGAARSVTGSRHLVEANGRRILLDCGFFQGRRADTVQRNVHLGFNPGEVDAVVLSHAHIDHSGALPTLAKGGFRGPIHATPATADLCSVMLRDSAHIQEHDIEIVNRREGLTGDRAKAPIYTIADAEKAVRLFRSHPYHETFAVSDGVTATFLDAGHILGSSMVRLEVREGGKTTVLLFSGDLGRPGIPIVRQPEAVDRADVLLLETTYGNREHPPVTETESALADIVKRVVARQGKVIIPAFAVGRTQHITWLLNELWNAKRIPAVPVFVDSPLAIETTEIFRRHSECWDPAMVRRLEVEHDPDPFGFQMLKYLRSPEESKKLNTLQGPAIIISASGMCENGRILHHLANNLQDRRNLVLIVGYQAEGTLGRRLVEGADRVMIYGREVQRQAEVVTLNALSAHAGRGDLEKFVGGFQDRVRKLFLVHGEPEQSEAFAAWATKATSAEVRVPDRGESAEL